MPKDKNFTKKNFKKWGKLGGRPKQYVSVSEKQKAYRRRKALAKLSTGQSTGILNWTTGRINQVKPRKLTKTPQNN